MLIGKKYWNTIAKGYSKTGGAIWVRHPWTVRLSGKVSGKKILELGCGTGVIINKLVSKGAIGTGADYSNGMLLEATSAASQKHLKTKFVQLDIRNLKTLYGKTYDVIIISAVLITFPTVKMITRILSEAAKVLSSDGTILIAEPHPFFDHYMRSFFKIPENIGKIDYLAKGKKYIFEMTDENNNSVESIIYHWRLEDYAKALHACGLVITDIFEPKPMSAAKQDKAWYFKRSRLPAYLFIKAKQCQSI